MRIVSAQFEGLSLIKRHQAVYTALADLPTVVVQDQSEYKASVVGQVDQILATIYALLGLAIIISILGIVNTLALSVVERTREIGLLRAVGMSRQQMKSSIRWESTVIAVFGALLGLGLGVIFGVSLQMVLRNEGIQLLSIPWGQLIAFLIVSALVGVLAALGLAGDHHAAGDMGDAHGRIGCVHMLPACTRRAIGIDPKVAFAHININIIINHGIDPDAGKAGVSTRVGIIRADADKAVDAAFRLGIAIGIFAFDHQRG